MLHGTRIGTRVHFLPDFYITRLIPPNRWTGTIKEQIKSVAGLRTRYMVELDPQFQTEAQETEVDAIEEEMERHENDE
jgi:hypothetical protein